MAIANWPLVISNCRLGDWWLAIADWRLPIAFTDGVHDWRSRLAFTIGDYRLAFAIGIIKSRAREVSTTRR